MMEKPRGLPQKRSTTFFRIPLQVDCSFSLAKKDNCEWCAKGTKDTKHSENTQKCVIDQKISSESTKIFVIEVSCYRLFSIGLKSDLILGSIPSRNI